MSAILTILAVVLGAYLLAILALLLIGRKESIRALVGFVPDCIVLFSRLMKHPCVPRRRSLLIGALLVYLASPIDLIPDFLPVVGYFDDAILVAVVLRLVVRGCSTRTLEELWPGPDSSLRIVLILSGVTQGA